MSIPSDVYRIEPLVRATQKGCNALSALMPLVEDRHLSRAIKDAYIQRIDLFECLMRCLVAWGATPRDLRAMLQQDDHSGASPDEAVARAQALAADKALHEIIARLLDEGGLDPILSEHLAQASTDLVDLAEIFADTGTKAKIAEFRRPATPAAQAAGLAGTAAQARMR